MAKTTMEKVKKYKVIPGWGNKNLRMVSETCFQHGKTLFCKNKGWRRADELHDSPQEAIDYRIEECVKEMLNVDKEAAELQDAVKQLKALKKENK